MKKIQILIALSLLTNSALYAQEETTAAIKKIEFVSAINVGFMTGYGEFNTSGTVTNGLLFKNRFSASIGTGVEGNTISTNMPFFLEGKYFFVKKKSHTPFVSVLGGYLQPVGNRGFGSKVSGGITAGTHVGYQNFFSKNVGIATSLGYRFSYQKYDSYYPWHTSFLPYPENQEYIYYMNRLEFRISLIFK